MQGRGRTEEERKKSICENRHIILLPVPGAGGGHAWGLLLGCGGGIVMERVNEPLV